MRFKEGVDRQQCQFFTSLDDLLEDKHYARLIDLFVDNFMKDNLKSFSKVDQQLGRKAYHPGTLLKIFIYSYLNGISSSRKIEKECLRNIEMIWLTGHLAPDHKTISDFRRENNQGIKQTFRELNLLLKQGGYIKGKTVSVDGSKIRANAGMSIDLETVSHKLDRLENQLSDYLNLLEKMDHADDEIEVKQKAKEQLEKEIEDLQKNIDRLHQQKRVLEDSGAKKISSTDPDSRIMKSRQGKHFCYNMQAAIDAEHQFIAASYVTSNEHDRWELSPMNNQLKRDLGITPKELLADAGYYTIKQIEELEGKSINCYVAINYNQQKAKEVEFTYHKEENKYVCSEGEELLPKNGLKVDRRRDTKAQAYVGTNCELCSIRSNCTTSKTRTIYRFTNQEWRDQYESKMNSALGRKKMIQRKSLSEHPFGTIKYWMGHIPLKTRGLHNVSSEIGLYSICYNLKRLMNVETFDRIKQMFDPSNSIQIA